MNNRKLFEIREIKGWQICIGIAIIVLLCSVLIFGFVQHKSGFLKFYGENQYKPMSEPNKGLYGKINYYLEMALKEGETKNKNLNASNLNDVFSRLKFDFPTKEGQLVQFEEVRLKEFIPDGNNKDEVQFYYNSDFIRILKKQSENSEKQYFIIDWDKSTKSIKSIKIDSTFANVPLQNANWNGTILMDDPFTKVNKNVMYLLKDNKPIPLFSSNRSPQDFENYRNRNNEASYKVIEFKNWDNYSISEYETIYQELNYLDSTKSKSIKIDFGNGQYISFLNSNGKLQLQWNAIGINILKDGKEERIKEEQKEYKLVGGFKNIIQLQIKTDNNKEKKHIISVAKEPFNKVSLMVNNLSRVNINEQLTDLSVKQQLVNITNILSNEDNISQLHLTSNPFLSKYLEDEMKKYYENTLKLMAVDDDKKDEFQISICLMDIATGEIISIPFYSNRMKNMNLDVVAEVPNYNFTNHDIGSVFKPLLSFAVAKRFPSLKDFSFLIGENYSKNIDNDNAQMLGYRTEYYGSKSMYSAFWDACANRKTFLATSHDNYPVALSMLALSEEGDRVYSLLKDSNLDNKKLNNLALLNNYQTSARIAYNPNDVNKKAHFKEKDLHKSDFAKLLEKLYDISAGTRTAIGMIYSDTLFWRNLNNTKLEKKLRGFAPNRVFMQLDKTTNFRSFERFVIGQGNNLWNNVKLAEAYSRLLSKKEVRATLIKNSDTIADWLDSADNKVWFDFMTDWQWAVKNSSNLLTPAYNTFKKAVPDFDNKYHFYCKTGTPQENNEMNNIFINGRTKKLYRDEGIFCFGIINKITSENDYPRGIVGVVYIKHLSEKNPGKGVESSTARNFLTSDIYKKIMFYNKNRFQ